MTTTRRLAAILAADVAGFSAAMERDEEGTAAAVRALRREVIEPKLAEHHGRLIKTTGDGFLAEFASPISALNCALAIQQRPGDGGLKLRIGLNLGDVIIEESGDVLGEGVNVASRLEGLAEPGGILISGKIFSEVDGKVPAEFEDRGEQAVKNISKPVRAYSVRTGAQASALPLETGKTLPLPDRPSIAVLPFQNMSSDPDQEYFADGIVEEIITALSHFKSLFVIARNSSFTYKGKAVDIKQVGRELGVRYVLEGSVRKAGGRVRITGQLIEAETGTHVWADRFDREIADIFALQDEVTQSVVSAVEPSLRSAEIARKNNVPTQDLNAYDLYLRALAEINGFSRSRMQTAEDLLRRAIAIDPYYSDAWAMLADALGRQIIGGWRDDAETREEVRRAALTATRTGPENGFAHSTAAYLAMFGGPIDAAVQSVKRALTLHPNSDEVRAAFGYIMVFSGEFDAALENLQIGLRIAPFGPRVPRMRLGMAQAYFFKCEFAEAVNQASLAIADIPENPAVWRFKTAALAKAGRLEEAREALDQFLTLMPNATISSWRVRPSYRHAWMRQLLDDGLRLAGLPE